MPRETAQVRGMIAALDVGQDGILPNVLAALNEQLSQLSPEERAQLEAVMRRFAQEWESMSAVEQAQLLAAAQAGGQRQQIESLAAQARDGAMTALRGETAREPLIARIEHVAA